MNWKRFAKSLLFPHTVILIVLLPVATALLVYSFTSEKVDSAISYIAYVISAYTLTIWCAKAPYLIRFFKTFKEKNKYVNRWFNDVGFKINVSLYGTLLWNTVYAIFQFGLGYYHSTFWFYSLSGYYFSLAVMRFFLVRHTSRHKPGEKIKEELIKYRTCGIALLIMNLALTSIIFFMVYWNRTFIHHEITTIAIAAYTFVSLTVAIINVIRHRKYNSPVYTASKAISLAAACVSMLILESTMLTTFNDGSITLLKRQIMLAVSGGVISLFIIGMAICMIVQSNKKIKSVDAENQTA